MQLFRRFADAIGREWKRLMIGVLLSLVIAVSSIIGMFVITEWKHVTYHDYDMAQFELALLMFAVPSGALIAYAGRSPQSQKGDR